MQGPQFFKHFKKYAEFIKSNPQFLREITAMHPLAYQQEAGKKNEGIPNLEKQKAEIEKSCLEFLDLAIKGKAEEETKNKFEQWINKKFYSSPEKEAHILQLIKLHQRQKEIFLELLPSYSQETSTIIMISLELCRFHSYITEIGFQTLNEIKKDEIFQEKELISSVIDNTVNGVLAYDTNLQVTEANAVVCDLLRLKKCDVIGKHIFEVLPFYKGTEVGQAMKTVLSGTQVFISERPFVKQKGYYEANLNPLYDSEASVIGGVVIIHETTHRKKAEDALKQKNQELIQQQQEQNETQAFLKELMESVPSLIFLYDIRKNTSIFTNEKVFGITGYTPEELKNTGNEIIGKIILPEDVGGQFSGKDFSRFDIYRSLKSNELLDGTFKVKHKNGSIRWLRAKSKAYKFNREGNPTQILGIAEDITELKESQEKIIQARDYYLQILEDFPVLIWRSGKEGKCDFFNKSWLEFTGRTLEEELLSSWTKEVHPDDVANFHKTFQESFQNCKAFKREFRLKRHDGTYRYLVEFGKPIYDLNGTFTGFIGACFDIQDRIDNEKLIHAKNQELAAVIDELKTTQKELTNSKIELEKLVKKRTINLVAREEQIKTITDALPVLITYVDKDLRCKFINKAIEKYLSLPREKIIGRPLQEIIKPESFQALKPEFEKVFKGETLQVELQTEHQELGTLYFSIDLIPEKTRKEVIGFYGLVFNVTERKKAIQTMEKLYEEANKQNKKLQRINTVLDNFVFTASHDLKSPVYNQDSLIQILKELQRNSNHEEETKVIEMLSLSANKLKKTLDDLIKVTKLQQQSELERTEIVSFKEVLNSVKADLKKLITESKAEIREDFQVTEIHYHQSHLHSIFYNLLSNALKYRRPNIPLIISIKTQPGPGCTKLKIKDNGIGMSPEEQQQIFKPFKRIHQHIEGTGIGLYSIKRIIEINGGNIKVKSRPGEGTKFSVYFYEQ